MTTLLLRLAGPLQSWGTESRFTERDTGREPSKSGVIGLICAALGRPRDADISDLVSLRMGVRVDQEGTLIRDFHTTKDIYRSDGGIKPTNVSNRYYLSDASFLVGLQADSPRAEVLLNITEKALRNPHWQIFLGRKACLPSIPVWAKQCLYSGKTIEQMFVIHPCVRTRTSSRKELSAGKVRLRCVADAAPGAHSGVRTDLPLSFATREFIPRHIVTYYVELNLELVKELSVCSSLA
ncbi:MAG: type I-E CRISPR-associated protein Cas5/CasD [candidate division Zixibacteria bacterium]|nr:type I-E CRISPR-associated protein Cas5/CasD [candidate division Zixibacteria bacterium]